MSEINEFDALFLAVGIPLLFLFIFILGSVNYYNQIVPMYDEFDEVCKNLNYTESTDYHFEKKLNFGWEKYKIECDGVKIIDNVKYREDCTSKCIQKDKWDECIDYNNTCSRNAKIIENGR